MTDEDAARRLERWAAAFAPAIFRTAYLVLGDAETAANVARGTFIRAHRAARYASPGDAFRVWLYRIAFDEMRRSDPTQAVLTARYFLDMSPEEIAAVLGKSPRFVRSKLDEARRQVEPALSGDGRYETRVRMWLDERAHEVEPPADLAQVVDEERRSGFRARWDARSIRRLRRL